MYKKEFVDDLAEILEENLPEENADTAERLACASTENESDAVDKVNQILAGIRLNLDDILDSARARKAEEVVQDYVRRKPNAVAMVDKILAESTMSMEMLIVQQLVEGELCFDHIGQIDRLITIAENRRDTSLREVDRRRAILGETLRRTFREIEDTEFQVIEPAPAKGKNAA